MRGTVLHVLKEVCVLASLAYPLGAGMLKLMEIIVPEMKVDHIIVLKKEGYTGMRPASDNSSLYVLEMKRDEVKGCSGNGRQKGWSICELREGKDFGNCIETILNCVGFGRWDSGRAACKSTLGNLWHKCLQVCDVTSMGLGRGSTWERGADGGGSRVREAKHQNLVGWVQHETSYCRRDVQEMLQKQGSFCQGRTMWCFGLKKWMGWTDRRKRGAIRSMYSWGVYFTVRM